MRKYASLAAAFFLAGCGTNQVAETSTTRALRFDDDCHGGTESVCAIEKRITELVNEKRRGAGKPALTHHARLGYVSRDWSKKQGEAGQISHDGFPFARNKVSKDEFGGLDGLFIAGENVAMYGPAGTVDGVATRFVEMWWNSPGHRENMLGGFEVLGAGVAQTKDGAWYGTQLFGQK